MPTIVTSKASSSIDSFVAVGTASILESRPDLGQPGPASTAWVSTAVSIVNLPQQDPLEISGPAKLSANACWRQ
jgi:hypothetical protein